ncbi:MAG: hypothetical protein JF584_07930, partial [Acidobacteria bacterium]|nr:hypothetical protein [Acidobacteriota bacterium]
CLASLIYYNRLIAMLFAALLVAGYVGLRLGWSKRAKRESRDRIMQER